MGGLSASIIGRAKEKGLLSIEAINIRDFAENKHNRVDDYTYGGGAGMLMQAQLMQGDTLLVSMFTELFDMAPAECNTEAFFTIPEIGGLEP